MADSLFDIFGDHLARQVVKNVTRQPFSNIENMGKTVSTEPVKPNEPKKKMGETKKSFLSNTGKALQSTPMRKAFTPKTINVGSLIYTDDNDTNQNGFSREELVFTKPSYKYDNCHRDVLDYLPMPDVHILNLPEISPPNSPPPSIKRPSTEFDCSYHDEFFTDDFSNESMQDDDLGLPQLY